MSEVRTKTPVTDDWRQWIAENLSLGGDPESLHRVMVEKDVDPYEAAREVQLAVASPYVRGARLASERIRNRLRKREWILEIHRKLARQSPRAGVVERRERLSADEFLERYYLVNRPVIITGMFEDWPARQKWSFEYLRERFGEREVEIQIGRDRDANYEINCPAFKGRMPFGEYIDRVANGGPTNDYYMTANNSSSNKEALKELWEDIRPIDEYLDPSSPDDGFLWIGPAGTRTPFHHDLTNNFMAQVLGRKHVKLIPACDAAYVYNHLHCYSQVDGHRIDYDRFPLMNEAQVMECELAPGELLFLPVGCWHYVEGLSPSVTMSFINFKLDNNFERVYSTYHDV